MGYVNIMVFTEDLWFLSGVTTVLLQKTWQVWVAKICLKMGHAQINVMTRACRGTFIVMAKQAGLTHDVSGKELKLWIWLCCRTQKR